MKGRTLSKQTACRCLDSHTPCSGYRSTLSGSLFAQWVPRVLRKYLAISRNRNQCNGNQCNGNHCSRTHCTRTEHFSDSPMWITNLRLVINAEAIKSLYLWLIYGPPLSAMSSIEWFIWWITPNRRGQNEELSEDPRQTDAAEGHPELGLLGVHLLSPPLPMAHWPRLSLTEASEELICSDSPVIVNREQLPIASFLMIQTVKLSPADSSNLSQTI